MLDDTKDAFPSAVLSDLFLVIAVLVIVVVHRIVADAANGFGSVKNPNPQTKILYPKYVSTPADKVENDHCEQEITNTTI